MTLLPARFTGPSRRGAAHRSPSGGAGRMPVATLIEALFGGPPSAFRITAYDGSATGPTDAPIRWHIASEEGLRYLASAPGDLGVARAYLTDQLTFEGFPPGDPYEGFKALKTQDLHRPPLREIPGLLRGLGWSRLNPPPPPDIENVPRWRRTAESLREPAGRRAKAIAHHYDVSNAFYELVLGPSMTYTCACYASPEESLEAAQERKYALVAGKLGLRPGMTLLDVGCGWGGMVRFAAKEYGVRALGVTLSKAQADWAQDRILAEGLGGLAEVRHLDYRAAPDGPYDAISSIGLTEHIGVRHYPAYFTELARRLRPGGRLLNHCITRPNEQQAVRPEPFTDRYVFPDGELAPVTRVAAAGTSAGLEIAHVENLRMSYAYTLRNWCANLVAHWDDCVAEVGTPTAKVWGAYMAGSRLGFELNWFQLHQVLFAKAGPDGAPGYPLRPDWSATPGPSAR